MERIQKYLSHLQNVLDMLSLRDVREVVDMVMSAYENDKQIFAIGNGGSASTASHIGCDLGKGTISVPGGGSIPARKRFRAISLTDNVATMTAWSNDTSYDDIFVEQLKNLVNSGDLIIGISVSGNSENVVRAMQYAKAVGCYVIAWTGIGGGKMDEVSDLSVIVESDQYGPVEDVHLILNHILHAWISEELASRNA